MANPFPTDTEMAVLNMLQSERDGLYGLEIVKASNGKLKRGSIYVVLSRLQDKGFVSAKVRRDAGHAGLPRPRYKLTPVGERVVKHADLMRLHDDGAYA
jgi:DNA-binding PadR family transcriptional regulator